jgi:predicted AAA+ superfamily ATPase
VHHVAREIRTRPCPPAAYVLVGSRPLTLAAAVVEAWEQADASLRVDGLSHAEISAARPDLSIPQRLLRGGFPALYADPAADVGEFMRALVAEHLARELPLQLRVDSVHDFERFLRAAACRTGRLLNKAELAREIGIAGSTAAIWLDTLADAGVITLVRPWQPPQGKPLVKSPKLFFLDTGLCAALLGIRDEQALAASPHAAALWETAVHAELRRLLAAIAPRAELAFWRDRTKEVDFLLPTRRGLALIDASWSEFAPPATAGRLLRIRDLIGAGEVATLAVVCRSPHGQSLRQPAGPDVETVGLDDLPTLLG